MRYAITGSIGTGKTTIANIFKERGYIVYDADKMVHDLYEDKIILKTIEKMFPDAFCDGVMNKEIIASIIFNDDMKKKELEEYIHPLVREEIKKLDNVIVEVPLLYESKMEDIFDKVILVYCNRNEQIKRIIARNNITKDEAIKRINSQMNIEEKKKYADFVLINEGSMEYINKQVDDIISKL